MAVLYSIALYVFHALYALSEIILLLRSWLSFWLDSDRFLRPRANLPDHLAVAFTSKRTSARGKGGEQAIWDDEEAVDMMVKNAWSVIEWCKIVGIPQVTLYDRDGLLKAQFRASLASRSTTSANAVDTKLAAVTSSRALLKDKYLTPPPSDDSESSATASVVDDDIDATHQDLLSFTVNPPSLSSKEENFKHPASAAQHGLSFSKNPRLRGRPTSIYSDSHLRTVRVNVASASDGLPAIARAARVLALERARNKAQSQPQSSVSVQKLDEMLLADLSPPSFLIIHNIASSTLLDALSPPRVLDAFPPWHLRLSEIYFTTPKYSPLPSRRSSTFSPLERGMFVSALDEYAKAEKREGK